MVQADLNGNAIKGTVGQLGGLTSQSVNDMVYAGGQVHMTGVLGNTVICGGYQVVKPSTGMYNYVAVYADSANEITGRTFYDMNSNSIFDAGDINYSGALKLKGGSNTGGGYSNGSYKMGVPIGTFTTEIATPPLYYTQTPLSYVSTFTTFGKSDTANHFYYQPIPNQNDLNVNLWIWPVRPGFNGTGYALLKNAGTTVKSGSLTVVLNSSLTVISCTPAALSVISNTITFPYSGINPLSTNWFNFTYTTSLAAATSLGQKAKCYASVVDPLDLTPIDNSDTIEPIVTGSFDPNVKEVYPVGGITPAFVSSGQSLDYTIHFQNTGNDTAFTVVIKDTLSSFLEPVTFQLVASSHSVSVSMNGRNISFNFNNILLPDSNINEPKSHGFVSYKIKPKSSVVIGDTIKNTAFIYFDFNSPIVTNTTKTPVQVLSGIKEIVNETDFIMYPNPASALVNLISRSEPLSAIKLYSVDGKLLYADNTKASTATISLSGLPAGLYLVNFRVGDKVFTRKLIIE